MRRERWLEWDEMPELPRQPDLFGEFRTARPGNPLYCHQEFLEKLHEARQSPAGKRAALLLHRLLVDESRQYYKGTQGVNRGWRRSRLGGRGGSHFYAWWATKGSPVIKSAAGFEQAPDGAIFIRDIRHHDDHSVLSVQSLENNYLEMGARDLRSEEYVPSPWTAVQNKFATARQTVRLLKGYPGSGKTTALWNAADLAAAESVLYITYSADLAALARDHFDKFAPANKRFHVVTFSRLVRDLIGSKAPLGQEREARAALLREVGGRSPRVLGPWVDHKAAFCDEVYAHLIGSALPEEVGRFGACQEPRVPDRAYRERRERVVGRAAAEALLETASLLRKRDGRPFIEEFFPELDLAWKAAVTLRGDPNSLPGRSYLEFDCMALDEAQDLTPLESYVVARLAAVLRRRLRGPIPVLVAGDEAQTVRPTDFEWGWFQDVLHHFLGNPTEFQLAANLRSPKRIAEVVNSVWDLYGHIAKHERPSGSGLVEIDEDASDQIVYCAATPGDELSALLTRLSEREGLALVSLNDEAPAYVPEAIRHRVLRVQEAKGLDFHSVCVLDAGQALHQVVKGPAERVGRDFEIESLSRRLAIDQLRVSLSRPAERLYWLDVSPRAAVLEASLQFLNRGSSDLEVAPVIPSAVLRMLDEELLDPEERIRICQKDALQFLEVKPELAWTRARQAVSLLGTRGRKDSIEDDDLRRSAHGTLVRVAATLALRRVKLPPELGRPNLHYLAAASAEEMGRRELAGLLRGIWSVAVAPANEIAWSVAMLGTHLTRVESTIDPWLLSELAPQGEGWIRVLEEAASQPAIAAEALRQLPAFYRIFGVPGAEERLAGMRRQTAKALIARQEFEFALDVLRSGPQPDPKLEAQCFEGQGLHKLAAEAHRRAGNLAGALKNYRAVADFEKALEMIREIPDHPAAPSLLWMRQMQQLAEQRPENFNRNVTEAEKKLLEQILESSLGVQRRKKVTAKRAPAPGKAGGGRRRSSVPAQTPGRQ